MQTTTSSSTAGTWLELDNISAGGKRWGVIATGSANGEGAGRLLLRSIADGTTVMTLDGDGRVGIGSLHADARLHVVQPDVYDIGIVVNAQGSGVSSVSGLGYGVYGETRSVSVAGIAGASGASDGGYGVSGSCVNANGYDFYAKGAGINYGAPSSIRWKRNIAPVTDPLGKLAKIRGVYYDWDEEHGGGHDIGFIGEEVGEVVPEIVAYEPDGEYVTGMDYGRMTPLLVEAVNALRAEKDAEIADLTARLARVEHMLALLTAERVRENAR